MSILRKFTGVSKNETSNTALVVEEMWSGKVNDFTWDQVAFANSLQSCIRADIIVLTLGDRALTRAESIAQYTGHDCIAIPITDLDQYQSDGVIRSIESVMEELSVKWIIGPGSAQGSEWAPALAGKLRAACVTNVSSLEFVHGRPIFHSPIYGGKFTRAVNPMSDPMVITIRQGCFQFQPSKRDPGKVTSLSIDTNDLKSISIKPIKVEQADSRLKEASVVVSGGRGVGCKEGFRIVEKTASLFSRSAVGCSRPVCDLGWQPYSRQIGQTGLVVQPELYLACGISGAQQHIMGMERSKLIVSINTDPNAAIFNHSDICVVEDYQSFLTEFIEQVERDK